MQSNKGFTLIELAIVIAIIGILSAVAVPKFLDLSQQAETAAAEKYLQSLQGAAAIYLANESQAPVIFSDYVTNGVTAAPFTLTTAPFLSSANVVSIVPAGLGSSQMTVNFASGFAAIYYLNGTDVTASIP